MSQTTKPLLNQFYSRFLKTLFIIFILWNPIIQNPTFGKIIKKFPSYNQIIIEHWIINDMLSTTDTPIIQKCNGCVIHQQVIISGIISCTNIYNPSSYAIVI